MIEFERTQDYTLIREILTHEKIFPHIGDDFAPGRDVWRPLEDDRIWYVIARHRGEILGLFLSLPTNAICWECHVSMLPCAWGELAKRAGREVIPWILERTKALRLVAQISDGNPLAIRYAKACGFKTYGRNEKSWMKNGKLHDQVCLGYSPAMNF